MTVRHNNQSVPLLFAVFDESGNFLIYATMMGIKGDHHRSNGNDFHLVSSIS